MKNTSRIYKLRSSLLSRYLLIIVAALLFIPVMIPLSLMGYGIFQGIREGRPHDNDPYARIGILEDMWHKEALELRGKPAEVINERLQNLSLTYSKATLFWVDAGGKTRLVLNPSDPQAQKVEADVDIPLQWSAAEAIAFMKKSTKLDPAAIVAFVGDQAEAGEGFMVMLIPDKASSEVYYSGISLWFLVVVLLFFISFIVVSWLFFIGIRKRLMRLQTAMVFTGDAGVPEVIAPGKPDEIGRLEEAFNTMVAELAASRLREAEEEGLRRRLVSDLSHDLRTPLTVIRSHLHILGKERMSPRAQESLALMDERIAGLGVLIENLLSYNLLSNGKITLNLERKDVLRLVRESAAAWYPIWEKEGFQIEIDLEADPLYWTVDESWFRRILDNLFQNILRHARSGLYVGITAEVRGGLRVIVISDHGQGMDSDSEAKGAGLGLSIVDLLLKRMELDYEMVSTGEGTSFYIHRQKNLNKT